MIDDFSGKYQFLSNFYPVSVEVDGIAYPSVEHAFQAAKTPNPQERAKIRKAETAAIAKRLGRKVKLRPDWESAKDKIMYGLLEQKFQDPTLRQWLIATGDEKLVEGNDWHDNHWGTCNCKRCGGKGRNTLGRMLMKIRQQYLPTTVVNIYHQEPYDVYIGRAGKGQDGYFGNPIRVDSECPICGKTHTTGGGTLKCYKQYFTQRLREDPEFKRRILGLRGKVLACFCKPAKCHGDVIVKYLEWVEKKQKG